ncbi:MAG: TIGR00282 family metallophosphoesterase, partial [Planctomycetota bacterium]
GLFCVAGRLFMPSLPADSPFNVADRMLKQMPTTTKVIVCDVHAEATSEKVAMGWHLDGRASIVFGTHTHIPTADARILPGGTAYITDLGMCGPYDSVLGRRTDAVLSWMTGHRPQPFDVATGNARLCGVIVDVDETTGKATHIERYESTPLHVEQAYDAEDSQSYEEPED